MSAMAFRKYWIGLVCKYYSATLKFEESKDLILSLLLIRATITGKALPGCKQSRYSRDRVRSYPTRI